MKFYIHLNFNSARVQNKIILDDHYDRLEIPEESRLIYFHEIITVSVTKDVVRPFQSFFKSDNNLYVDICMSNMLKSDLTDIPMSRLHQILKDSRSSPHERYYRDTETPLIHHKFIKPQLISVTCY